MSTAFISGVGRGIGQALAHKFLTEGYRVIGTSQSGSVEYSHDRLSVLPLDLASAGSIAACADEIVRLGTEIDILINNAGGLFDEDETRVDVHKLRQTLEVNLIGTIDFTERMIPALRDDAHIVSLSSQAGSLGEMDRILDSHFPYHYPAYKISKCALNMYTRTLAVRLTHEGTHITVSSVHPGWVRTEMGGDDAPVLPEEAAADIFALATSRPETGQFWFKGKKYPW